MRGIKRENGKQELTGRDIIVGRNGAGKTTRAQALGIALMGYVPGGGKLPAETMKLAHGDSMTVGIDTETFSFTRSFERKGAEIKQTVTLNPPNGEKTVAAKEKRIEQELGKFPVMLDFNEFLSLSDMKRREFIYMLVDDGEGMDSANKDLAIRTLCERLILPETADPQEAQVLADDIDECAAAYNDSASVQAGLQAMADYAKEQMSYWKKERDKSVGAAQKIAEYKNDLAETDRNLDTNNKRLEEVQGEFTQASSRRATTVGENQRLAACNEKIAALQAEIDRIEQTTNTGNIVTLRECITHYGEDLRQVDNGAEIAALTADIEAASGQLSDLEKTVEACRDEYQTIKGKRNANEDLLKKLWQQTDTCPIDCRIECDKDFSDLISELTAENEGHETALNEITRKGIKARANLDGARQAIQDTQHDINRLRDEEVSALRDNESIQAIIREYEAEIAKTESFDATKEATLTAKREELRGILPPDGNTWAVTDIKPMDDRITALDNEAQSLKAKIAEQTKARNTLATLKSSMVDGTVAGYHADAWKRIAEAVGPKGLQGEIIKDTLAPLTEAVQSKLGQMSIDKVFYFQTDDEKGKEVFQFGWHDADGERRNFDALSTGEQMLLLIALMTTVIERMNPPLKALVIDNAENLDSDNLLRVVKGLMAAGEELDNIIFLGVMDLIDISPELYGWRVWDLSEGQEVPHDQI
jgi:exonuclease SbcC